MDNEQTPADPPSQETPKSPSISANPNSQLKLPQAQPIEPQALGQLLDQAMNQALAQQAGLSPGIQPAITRPMLIQAPVGQMQAQQFWQGPFPPPEAIEHYEKSLPGVFDRLVGMAERMEAAQIEQSDTALKASTSEGKRGQYLGAGLGALALFCAAYVGDKNPWLGAAFLAVPVMGLAKSLVETASHRIGQSSTSIDAAPPAANNPSTAAKPDEKQKPQPS